MKLPYLVTIAAALLSLPLNSTAGEHYTLVAENAENQAGDSQAITLNQGDTAELKFAYHPKFMEGERSELRVIVSTGGKDYEMAAAILANTPQGGWTYSVNPVKIAGPAVIKLRTGGTGNTGAGSGFGTIEVNRAGTAGTPTAIPLEAGTTWQVILEASTDLVNWTAVAPGDYPSATPQRFFRTRLVKRP